MATRRKRWVKVPTSIIREDWPDSVLATCVRLSCWLGDRWARDGLTHAEASTATLNWAALHAITGRSQRASGVNALRTLGKFVSLSVQVDGELVSVSWPKWSELQGDTTPSPGSDLSSVCPAPALSEKETQKEDQNPSGSAADAASLEPELSAEEADRERRVRLAARLCPRGHDAIAFEVFVRQHLEQIEAYHRGKPEQRFPQALMAFYNRKRASMASEGAVPVGGRP